MRQPLLLVVACAALGAVRSAQCEVQTISPPDTGGGLGALIAQDGARFAVASARNVHFYLQVGRTAFHEQELVFPEFQDRRSFIISVALDGDRLALGIDSFDFPSSVRVFERQAGVWGEVIRFEDGFPSTGFGRALALEGERLFVGAPRAGAPPLSFSGAVYVYECPGGVWSFVERLVPQGVRLNLSFGTSLAAEGDRLVVGAPLAFSHQQSAYVFERTGGVWQQNVLTPAEPITAVFGESLALRGDVLLIGDSSAVGGGRAWVFERDGKAWAETGVLTQEASGRVFGFADYLALSADGKVALVASPYDDDPVYASGVVHVFEKSAGVWQRGEKLYPTRPGFLRSFGRGLACAGDLAVVGGSNLVTTLSVGETLCRTLFAQPEVVSLTQGGRQTLRLNPGLEHAGRRFLLMGSASGHDPGFRFGGVRIPLVRDAYFRSSLPGHRRPPLREQPRGARRARAPGRGDDRRPAGDRSGPGRPHAAPRLRGARAGDHARQQRADTDAGSLTRLVPAINPIWSERSARRATTIV